MKVRALLLGGGLVLLSSSSFGSTCLNNTTVAALQLLGANGCDVILANQTVTFSNFNASGSALNASAVLDMDSGIGLAGFTFTDPGSHFNSVFALSYTAAIQPGSCAANFSCAITGVFEQSALTPQDSTGSITLSESAGSPAALTVSHQTDNLDGTINVQTISKTATYNGAPSLISFESAVFATATTSVPEPLSLSLVGSGLIALGVVRRKKRL